VRTVIRVFQAETGLTFKVRRQRVRIVRAIDRLAGGTAIAQVPSALGFSSAASFAFAFRQVTNMTPSAFLERPA
jgi:methylphosphotriester-DNA--protein-cysteine methyltransferase